MPDMWIAAGHTAKVLVFDEKTILMPLNEREAWRLLNLTRSSYNILDGSKDFPERQEYLNLIENLHTAYWLLTDKPKKK